jgi:hypothetical protein
MLSPSVLVLIGRGIYSNWEIYAKKFLRHGF